MSCNLVNMHVSFEGTCYLHRHGTFKMESADSSEMLLQIHQNIQRHIQEEISPRSHRFSKWFDTMDGIFAIIIS
jgi:hypothetical protein